MTAKNVAAWIMQLGSSTKQTMLMHKIPNTQHTYRTVTCYMKTNTRTT